MSQNEHDSDPIDVFANLSSLLDDEPPKDTHTAKEGRGAPSPTPHQAAAHESRSDERMKQQIREAATADAFHSRQQVPKKPKILSKTFSMHKEEYSIITQGIRHHSDHHDDAYSQPSGSDVVRAALRLFATLAPDAQAHLIQEHRARGK